MRLPEIIWGSSLGKVFSILGVICFITFQQQACAQTHEAKGLSIGDGLPNSSVLDYYSNGSARLPMKDGDSGVCVFCFGGYELVDYLEGEGRALTREWTQNNAWAGGIVSSRSPTLDDAQKQRRNNVLQFVYLADPILMKSYLGDAPVKPGSVEVFLLNNHVVVGRSTVKIGDLPTAVPALIKKEREAMLRSLEVAKREKSGTFFPTILTDVAKARETAVITGKPIILFTEEKGVCETPIPFRLKRLCQDYPTLGHRLTTNAVLCYVDVDLSAKVLSDEWRRESTKFRESVSEPYNIAVMWPSITVIFPDGKTHSKWMLMTEIERFCRLTEVIMKTAIETEQTK